MTVAVAFRESDEGLAALAIAVDWAQRRGAELVVVHLLDIEDPALWDAERQAAEERIGDHMQRFSHLSWQVVAGNQTHNAAHAILDLAQGASAEILVIGTRRRSPAGKLLMGSTVQRVLLDASIPVLVVKPALDH